MNRIGCGVLIIALWVSLTFLPAGALDFTLQIFGNSNMDDTIDEQDIEYVRGIIDGTKDKTELSDANYDGTIDEMDIAQIELILGGKEKNLTFIDLFGDAVTINKPIERMASLGFMGPQLLRLIGAEDKLLPIVGGSKSPYPVFWGDISSYHPVGASPPDVDYEYILSRSPDVVQTNLEMLNYISDSGKTQKKEFEKNLPGILLIHLNAREPSYISRSILIYGYLFDREEQARKFASWHDEVLNKIKTISDQIHEDDKPTVLFQTHGAGYGFAAGGSRYGEAVRLAGGRNLLDEIANSSSSNYGQTRIEVDPEWVVLKNPQFILSNYLDANSTAGFETADVSGAKTTVDAILNTTELARVDAITNGNVYYIDNFLVGGGGLNIVAAAFLGKLWHPEEFKDIDPMKMLQEYMEFYDSNFDASIRGVFMYPSLADLRQYR
jgi:iron complex transport system substrate-binding protein